MNKLEETVEKIKDNGYLLSPEALDKLKEIEEPLELFEEIKEDLDSSKTILTSEDFERKKEVEVTGSLDTIPAKEYDSRIEVMQKDLTEESESQGELEDFVENFRSRCRKIHKILKSRGENSAVKIENVDKKKDSVKIIGLVTEKKSTKNGHIFMRVEDQTGLMKALIPNNSKDLLEKAKDIINDEVIALEGRLSNNDLFIINEIHYPDLPHREIKKTEEDIAIATTSDLHIGSKYFLDKNFENFLKWLKGEKGNERQKEIAGKVKYLTIAGDLVDGVGIYPDQSEELEITDIYGQYKELKKYIKRIPDHIEIIIGTGNHDAVNNADPQPKLPNELTENLGDLGNVTMVGSPATVKLHGMKQLMYHGTSFDDIIPQITSASYEKIEGVLKKILQCRHVHPIYGEKPITPEREDHLVLDEVPDIFHSGHVHKNGYLKYKGTICVNSGTWQEKTPFQQKIGHKPTPGKIPVIETKKGKINVLKFNKGIDKEGRRVGG